ncbi:MAG: (2Fe-2S)-binding protein, partial [Candidatus Lokiarchaeota archaeon]|nr:(2Fe-2S)-binding protein [Candidatus Lokiarchaeota archaeon]
TIAQIDKNFNIISGTERTFACDTILIAVGLNPVDEFYHKAIDFGFKVWIAGDAQEIAEASTAIFTGRIEAFKILEAVGIDISEDIDKLEDFAEIMKGKPPQPIETEIKFKEEGIYPVFYCNQEIPCNPCTTVCDQQQIETIDDLITQLPYFKGEQDCIGCGKCVAVCPGLAVVLLDYRKDKNNPLVTFPFELTEEKLEKGQEVVVVSNKKELGKFEIQRSRILKEFPKTQLITIKLPSKIAKQAVAIKQYKTKFMETTDLYQKSFTDDEIIVCRCERVSVGEIRKWIKSGVRDFNELKALTKVGMGSCGGKTCTPLIERIFRQEGVFVDDITPGTRRPLFIEVPMGVFANAKEKKEDL